MIERQFNLPQRSFFLFGPRGTGKSTLLLNLFKSNLIIYFDLLHSKTYLELSSQPWNLEAQINAALLDQRQLDAQSGWIVIDEIQKLPVLLDEVHRLIERKGWRFALSGSSARKLKRQGANLLAGRALVRRLPPFTSAELENKFNLDFALQYGNLPSVVLNSAQSCEILEAYVYTYLKEEIAQEGLVRKIEPFVRFLKVFGILNGQVLNSENIAREAHVKRTTIDQWLIILEDTLLGFRLYPWRPQLKVRESGHPKFYWFDPGVAHACAGILRQPLDSALMGFALETQIIHEIKSYLDKNALGFNLYFYSSGSGLEVDLIIQTKIKTHSTPAEIICIEIKNSKTWNRTWEKSIRSLMGHEEIVVKRAIGIYRGNESYFWENFEVMGVQAFLSQLHSGNLILAK